MMRALNKPIGLAVDFSCAGVVKLLVVVIGLAVFGGAAAAPDPLNVPLPVIGDVQGVQTAWVARKMSQNGVPMSIRSFKSTHSIDEVLQAYRKELLADGAPHADIVHTGGVNTLGAGIGPYFINVQGANHGGMGSAGFIVVSLIPGVMNSSTDTTLPVPDGAHVLSVQRYDEQGKKAESATMASTKAVSIMADDVKADVEDDGWSQLSRYSSADTGDKRFMMFKRDNEVLQAVVQKSSTARRQGSLILMTRMTER